MKSLGVLGVVVLSGFLAGSSLALAQQDQSKPDQGEKPKATETKPAKPAKPEQEHRSQDQAKQQAKQQQKQAQEESKRAQDQAKQQAKQEKNQEKNQKDQQQQQARQQQKDQQKQQEAQQKQAQKNAERAQKDNAKRAEQQNKEQAKQQQQDRERGNQQDQREIAQQRAPEHQEQVQRSEHGSHGRPDRAARISEDHFREHFGHEHRFAIRRPVIVDNEPRFQYSGYWFQIVDPWPVAWSYDDDCYIDYVDGGYFLFDPLHPGVQIAVVVVM